MMSVFSEPVFGEPLADVSTSVMNPVNAAHYGIIAVFVHDTVMDAGEQFIGPGMAFGYHLDHIPLAFAVGRREIVAISNSIFIENTDENTIFVNVETT